MKQRNARGFRVFGTVRGRDGDEWTVSESSLAFKGAHVRVMTDAPCMDFPGNSTGWHAHKTMFQHHLAPSMHLSVDEAKRLIEALQTFVREAEAGELMEGGR